VYLVILLSDCIYCPYIVLSFLNLLCVTVVSVFYLYPPLFICDVQKKKKKIDLHLICKLFIKF